MIHAPTVGWRLATLCALSLAAAPVASAETVSPWSAAAGAQLRLIAGAPQGEARTAGLEIRLPDGWKTYWRYPGDAGIPPHFDWSGSENVAKVEVGWPAPVRFDEAGSQSIGYKHEVIFPLNVTPKDASAPVSLKLTLDFAVCSKICQPASGEAALTLPATGEAANPSALAAAQAAVPRTAALGGPGAPAVESVELDNSGAVRSIRVVARLSGAGGDLFVEGPTEEWALPLPERSNGTDGRVVFTLPVDGVPKNADIAETPLRFTLVDPAGAVEITATPTAR